MKYREMLAAAERYMDQAGSIKDYPALLEKLEKMPYFDDPHSSDFVDDLLAGKKIYWQTRKSPARL